MMSVTSCPPAAAGLSSARPVAQLLWPAGFALFFCWFSWRIGGDGTPDFRAYHLYNGYALANGGRPQDIAAAQLQTYFFPGLDLLYWWLLRAFGTHPGTLHALLGLPYAGAAWAVMAIARTVLPPAWMLRTPLAAAAALLGTTGAAGFATIGSTMSDIVPDLPVLAALCLGLRGVDGPDMALRQRRLRAIAAGALCGLSVGLKLTAVPLFAGMLAAMILCHQQGWRAAAAEAALFAAAGSLVAAAVAGWWWGQTYAAFGNPVFPAFNDLFRSDLVDHGRWSDDRFRPRGWAMTLLYPAYWAFLPSHRAIELPMRDPRMLVALVSALAILVAKARVGRWRSPDRSAPAAVFLATFFLASYAAWEIQFSIYRYLAVPEALCGALALAATALWAPRTSLRGRRFATALLVLTGLLVVRLTDYPWWDRSLPSARVLDVELPEFAPDAMVIFLDPYAMSYTVPFMPASVRVIGANTNLVRPDIPSLLEQRIGAAIRAHQGPLWGMENGGEFPGAAEATLAHHGLVRAGPCVPIKTNVEPPRITACPLTRRP